MSSALRSRVLDELGQELERVSSRREIREAGGVSQEVRTRLEEVAVLIADAYALRVAGTPDVQLEAVLAARYKALRSAASSELSYVVVSAARGVILAGVGAVFELLIG